MDAIQIPQPDLYIASTKDEWINYINLALAETDNAPARERRVAMAKSVSWDVLAEQYNSGIRERFLNHDIFFR